MIYSYSEILSHLKRNEIYAAEWMNLEAIMLSAKARHKRPHMFYLFEMYPKDKSVETESRFVGA